MNVLVEAFVDNNLGDDLMLGLLVQRYPAVHFWVIGDPDWNFRLPYQHWENLLIIAWPNAEAILPAFDAFIGIGGSLWQEQQAQPGRWPREQIVQQFSTEKKPCLMIGNNIGPLRSAGGAAYFARIISLLDDMTVRDRASLAWVEQNCRKGVARLAADLVFGCALPERQAEPGVLGIAVHRDIHTPGSDDAMAKQMAALIRAVQRQGKYRQVRLFGFDSGVENDALLIDAILAALSPTPEIPLKKILYQGEPEPFLRAFRGCEHVVAARFHAVVLSVLYAIPFTPVVYQNKTSDFLADLGYSGITLTAALAQPLEQTVEQICTRPAAVDTGAVDAMRQRTEENFRAADRVLLGQPPSNAGVARALLRHAAQGAAAQHDLQAVYQSRTWRLLQRLRAIKMRLC